MPQGSTSSSLESFLEDRRAEHWYAGEPVRPEESVRAAIARFTPNSVSDDMWSRIGGFVTGVEGAIRIAGPLLFALLLVGMVLAGGRVLWRRYQRHNL